MPVHSESEQQGACHSMTWGCRGGDVAHGGHQVLFIEDLFYVTAHFSLLWSGKWVHCGKNYGFPKKCLKSGFLL